MGMNTQAKLIAVSDLIAGLALTDDARRLEILADTLGAARDRRAILPLLARLGDPLVQRHEHTEDAVCAALVALGVMRRSHSNGYMLLPRHLLEPDVATKLAEIGPTLPLRYFFVRR